MKFLIIRFSSIGDIVLTTPVVRCLKKQVVTAEIHFLTKPVFAGLVSANPYIDRYHVLQPDLDATIEALKTEDFDYVIDLHHNVRTLKIKRALGKKTFSFNKLNIHKWLLTALKINKMPDLHIVDRYMDTVSSFGVKNDGAGLDYFIPKEEELKMEDLPASHHAGYIGIVIGATYHTKRYPVHKLKEFCQQMDHPVVLLGGKEDQENGIAISAVDPVKIYNACGKFSLHESADIIKKAKVVITNDTGLMHIAAAFKKPVVSLWGNTVPAFGMYPYYGINFLSHQPDAPFDVLEVKNLHCRPCSKIGYQKCPLGHFKCMERIEVPLLLSATKARISGSGRSS
ncbi:MAG: glycosyltransferase family 9 protein [Chitinophagaceae bacterium]|nr:glycosyltransferase family 9 protein [Chitinophagaceae bacterium]